MCGVVLRCIHGTRFVVCTKGPYILCLSPIRVKTKRHPLSLSLSLSLSLTLRLGPVSDTGEGRREQRHPKRTSTARDRPLLVVLVTAVRGGFITILQSSVVLDEWPVLALWHWIYN